jgi:type VI secretion system secreted protein Hcp
VADFSVMMKVPGVTGDVTESAHTGWIRLAQFSWRARRALATRVGSVADRESTAPSVSEVEIRKENDSASGMLMQKFWNGGAQDITFDFVRTGDQDSSEVYYEVTLSNAIFSYFEQVSTGSRPEESLKINFTKIQNKITGMSALGTDANPFTTGFDLSTAKPI